VQPARESRYTRRSEVGCARARLGKSIIGAKNAEQHDMRREGKEGRERDRLAALTSARHLSPSSRRAVAVLPRAAQMCSGVHPLSVERPWTSRRRAGSSSKLHRYTNQPPRRIVCACCAIRASAPFELFEHIGRSFVIAHGNGVQNIASLTIDARAGGKPFTQRRYAWGKTRACFVNLCSFAFLELCLESGKKTKTA